MKRLLLALALGAALPAQAQTMSEAEAVDFLYQYMPLPDSADYSRDFWERNVACSMKARQEMPWGKTVPEREWRHFVLPVRVNNENLDEARIVFYEALRDRVRHLSMAEAVLEVNHWCHEHVTYTPSDARTSAPLATMRNAKGRCGEESTFCVAALRSVGIPARQVYTPRWAHTDDNHAWVEAWVDGRWCFLGACEPEPVLNLGWFNAPASRAMLMHTKVFGRYDGPETVMRQTPCFTEIDVTANYAPTASVTVRTVDREGRPVPATVSFRLYNYAEYFTLASRQSDKDGLTHFSSGLGDIMVWASRGRGAEAQFGFAKCSMGRQDTIEVCLDKDVSYCGQVDFDLMPPPERNNMPPVTDAQREANQRRLVYEDSIRTAYEATFRRDNWAVEQSRGNYNVIKQFLTGVNDEQMAMTLLRVISEKDLHDVTLDVLTDHYLFSSRPVSANLSGEANPQSLWARYVLNPRVSNEMLTPYKQYFLTELSPDFIASCRSDYRQWVAWVAEHVTIDESRNPQALCMSPRSVWQVRRTDSHSRNIFFVSVARTMGIASRIDEVTGKVQVYDQGQWTDIHFGGSEHQAGSPKGLLRSATPTTTAHSPGYYYQFTLAQMQDGTPVSLTYPEDGSATWRNLFDSGQTLDTGQYMLVSGTRLANGGVLAHMDFLPIREGETTTADLTMRTSQEEVTVIGSFNSENLYRTEQGDIRSLLSTTGRGYYVVGLIAPGQEPTNHALRDIAAVAAQLEQWGRSLVLLFESEAEMARFTNRDEFRNLPRNLVFGTDVDGKIRQEIWTNMYLTAPTMPVFLIADTFNRVLWCRQGYTIGLGQQLLDVIKKL